MQSLKHSHIWRCSDEVMPYIVLHEVTISFFLGYTTLQTKKMQQSSGYLKTAVYLQHLPLFFNHVFSDLQSDTNTEPI